jgi:hypothetical protein
MALDAILAAIVTDSCDIRAVAHTAASPPPAKAPP